MALTLAWCLHLHASLHLRAASHATRTLALYRQDAALLVYVARQGSAPSARVALLLWPGTEPRRAANSLCQRLHRLCRATGARLLGAAETAMLAADLSVANAAQAVAVDVDNASAGELLGGYDYDGPVFATMSTTTQASRPIEVGRKGSP